MQKSKTALEERCASLIAELGLGTPDDVQAVRPLTGGVASDIAAVVLPGRKLCVKFALPKLRVAADWRAPVHRNRAEYAWLEVAGGVAPDSAPRLYGRSERLHGFAMEFLEGEGIYLWKEALLESRPVRGEAAAVAGLLGRIHAASATPGFERAPFENRDDFHAIRIEPYLLFTAERHPGLKPVLERLAEGLYRAEAVLVHGDVSPKNIFFRAGAPLILDAECATLGDPAFDLAFCLNHLVLKAFHLPGSREGLFGELLRFWEGYRGHIVWEEPAALEARVAALLPALMLARVDGKSPVEYLSRAGQDAVRAVALPLIAAPPPSLAGLVAAVNKGS